MYESKFIVRDNGEVSPFDFTATLNWVCLDAMTSEAGPSRKFKKAQACLICQIKTRAADKVQFVTLSPAPVFIPYSLLAAV